MHVEYIFRELTVNIVQIYLEEILDLLNPTGQSLQVRENPVDYYIDFFFLEYELGYT